jgi:hypothetical protein
MTFVTIFLFKYCLPLKQWYVIINQQICDLELAELASTDSKLGECNFIQMWVNWIFIKSTRSMMVVKDTRFSKNSGAWELGNLLVFHVYSPINW